MGSGVQSQLWARFIIWFSLLALLGGCAGGPAAPGTTQPAVQGSADVTPGSAPPGTPARRASDPPAPAVTMTRSDPTPTATRPPAPTMTATVAPPTAAASTATPTATPSPGPTPDGAARELRVPILMYHYVSEPPADADIYRRDLSVAPERFESHLRYLREAGYQVITLDDLLYALARGQPLPDKPVILTFDDGYEDNHTNAFPLLQRYDMVGHFFIITDFVNQERPGYMNWPQIEEMAAGGQRFGSHSRDHPNLRGQSVDYLVWQALGGKESIEEHLGYHPRWISYPAGNYDEQTIAVYKSAHYWGGLTIRQGATHTLTGIFELKRVRVRGSYTAEDLARLLALDW